MQNQIEQEYFIHPTQIPNYLIGKRYEETKKDSYCLPPGSDCDIDECDEYLFRQIYTAFFTLGKLVRKTEYDTNLFPRSRMATVIFAIQFNKKETEAEKINYFNTYYQREKTKRTPIKKGGE